MKLFFLLFLRTSNQTFQLPPHEHLTDIFIPSLAVMIDHKRIYLGASVQQSSPH
jgi:hypothetical protein